MSPLNFHKNDKLDVAWKFRHLNPPYNCLRAGAGMSLSFELLCFVVWTFLSSGVLENLKWMYENSLH